MHQLDDLEDLLIELLVSEKEDDRINSINKNLKLLREASRMTQAEVGDALSVTKDIICSYESGKAHPNLETLVQLADIYQVDLHDILYGDNQYQRSFKKSKFAVLTLVTIMLVGILIHSVVLMTLNRFLPPTDLTYATVDYAAVVNMRLSLRQFAETFNGICSAVFLVGSIVMLYSFIKSRFTVAFHKIFLLFFLTVMAMLACVVPFAINDKAFWGDYLFPLWGALVIIVFLFSIMIVGNVIKRRRTK